MWKELSRPWKECFRQAWEAYCKGSIPIGAVLADENDNVIIKGRNRIYEQEAPQNQICHNKLAHAEMNVLLQVEVNKYKDIRKYTLYTTMEPCPLCFGACVMTNIKKIKFAARDRIGGGTGLNTASEFIVNKGIEIHGPDKFLEIVQLVIKTDFILKEFADSAERLLGAWEEECPVGVAMGRRWFEEGKLVTAKNNGWDVSWVIDEIERCIRED